MATASRVFPPLERSPIKILGVLTSTDELPTGEDNDRGDAYIIDQNLWIWNGIEWQDAGELRGPQGDLGPSLRPRGEAGSEEELPLENNQVGDIFTIDDYVWGWDGSQWVNLGAFAVGVVVHVSETEPEVANIGDLWYDPSGETLNVDQQVLQWVQTFVPDEVIAALAEDDTPAQAAAAAVQNVVDGLDILLHSDVLNEPDMATGATDKPPSQASVVAYVDGLASRLIPAGGMPWQVLGKASDADYDVAWIDPPGVVVPQLLMLLDSDLVGLGRYGTVTANTEGPILFVDDGINPYPEATPTTILPLDGTLTMQTRDTRWGTEANAVGPILFVDDGGNPEPHVPYIADRSIEVVGDMHLGWTPSDRVDDLKDGLAASDGTAALRVFIGDQTQTGSTEHADIALAFMNDTSPSGWWAVIGNHDLQHVSNPTWDDYYGQDHNWYTDIGDDLRVIGVSPDEQPVDEPITLAPATLSFLDDRLDETDRDCLICCHAPLANTVRRGYYDSADPFFAAHPDADIRAILAAHENARAWISGHTHSSTEAPDLIKREPLGGGRYIAAINVSATAYIAYGSNEGRPYYGAGDVDNVGDQPLYTAFVSCFDDRVEVRFRNLETGAWALVKGRIVTTIDR